MWQRDNEIWGLETEVREIHILKYYDLFLREGNFLLK